MPRDRASSRPPVAGQAADGVRRQATKGIAWQGIQIIGTRVLNVATFVVLARLLDPRDFGVVALASVAVALATVFTQQGLVPAVVQRKEITQEHLDAAFWVSLTLGCGICAVLVGTAWPLTRLLGVPSAAPILAALAANTVLAGLSSVQQGILTRRMDFRSLARRQLLGNVVGAALGVGAALEGAGAWALVVQVLTTSLVGLIVMWRATGWRPGLHFQASAFREVLSFSNKVLGSSVASFFLRRTDDLVVGAVLGATSLGLYTVAYRLLTIMLDVTINTVQNVALPTLSRLQAEPERMRRVYVTATRLTAAVSAPAFCFVIIAAPELVGVFFGDKWQGSVAVMRILALIGVAGTLTNLNGTALTAAGRPDLTLRFMTISMVVNVASVLAVVHWGIEAVATALVLRTWLVQSPLSIYYVRRVLELSKRDYFSGYLGPFAGSLVMMAAVFGVQAAAGTSNAVLRLGLMVVVGLPAYLLGLAVTDRSLAHELLELPRGARRARRTDSSATPSVTLGRAGQEPAADVSS